jgi:hypothetical protein
MQYAGLVVGDAVGAAPVDAQPPTQAVMTPKTNALMLFADMMILHPVSRDDCEAGRLGNVDYHYMAVRCMNSCARIVLRFNATEELPIGIEKPSTALFASKTRLRTTARVACRALAENSSMPAATPSCLEYQA